MNGRLARGRDTEDVEITASKGSYLKGPPGQKISRLRDGLERRKPQMGTA